MAAFGHSEDRTPSSRFTLLCTVVVVFIVCGGNASGVLLAAIIWKFTGRVAAALLVLVALSLLGLILGLSLLLFLQKQRKAKETEKE